METTHEDGSSLRVASFSCYLDTAKESLVRRVSGQDSNISIKFSNKEQDSQLRVDSFSRLNSDHNLLFQVPAPIQDPTSAFSFSHHTPNSKHAAEIGVFGADRHFNMKLDYHTANTKTKTLLAPATTPSLCSDTTSTWNSLLPDQPHPMEQKKAMATRLFMGFDCRGPCFDKKSINTCPQPHLIKSTIQDLDESRRSIEVFGSRKGSSRGRDVATNMEQKLSMLTWDAIPKANGRNHPPTSTTGSTTLCDAASDASSDLFEIEDVSGTIYRLLEAPDDDIDASTYMSPATSLYAPSEASIQWSVVTASAADFSTALSDFNDDSVSTVGSAKVLKPRNANHVQKSRPSGLLGCKSLKSVDVVAPNVCVKASKN